MKPMLSFVQGQPRYATSMTQQEWVDFGGHVGLRPTYHFTLPEVYTIHSNFSVPVCHPSLASLRTAGTGSLGSTPPFCGGL